MATIIWTRRLQWQPPRKPPPFGHSCQQLVGRRLLTGGAGQDGPRRHQAGAACHFLEQTGVAADRMIEPLGSVVHERFVDATELQFFDQFASGAR